MKKIIFAIAIVLTLGLTATAQRGTDGFFGTYSNDIYGNRDGELDWDPIPLPNAGFDQTDDQQLPLGSGLIVLTALGAGYAVARKKK